MTVNADDFAVFLADRFAAIVPAGFRVEARDDFESIGGGSHQRVVVSVARFDERVQRKLRGAS